MATAGRLDLVVVRHGLTAWNRERRYQGHRDIPLLLPDAEPGLALLRDALSHVSFDAIDCSDLLRCRQTLGYIRPDSIDPEPCFDARLRELNFGEYEGRTYDDLKSIPAYRAWIDTRGEQAPPQGESAAALRARLDAWFEHRVRQCDPGRQQHVLVVSHGGVIRELRRRFEAIDFWEGDTGQAQGRHFIFHYQRGAWRCSSSSAVPAPASDTR